MALDSNRFPDESGRCQLAQALTPGRAAADHRQHRMQLGMDIAVDAEIEVNHCHDASLAEVESRRIGRGARSSGSRP